MLGRARLDVTLDRPFGSPTKEVGDAQRKAVHAEDPRSTASSFPRGLGPGDRPDASLGAGTVSGYLARAKVADLGWPLPDELDDAAIEKRLFVPREENRRGRPAPDFAWIHREIRGKNVTLALLWR